MFMCIMSGYTLSYGIACTNQLNNTFNAKYHWDTKSEKDIHQSLIGSAMMIGMTAGASTGGMIVKNGRRTALLIACLIGTIGVSLTMIENFYCLIIGRIIQGYASGVQTVASPRMIEEYVPIQI